MRKTLEQLIETCYDVKNHLGLSSYELHDYGDEAYADFRTNCIVNPKKLCSIIGKLDYRIIADNDAIRIRIFEDYTENG